MMIVLVTMFTIAGQDFERREVVPSFEVCWARAAVRMEELLKVHSGIDRIVVGCSLDAGKPA